MAAGELGAVDGAVLGAVVEMIVSPRKVELHATVETSKLAMMAK